MIMNLPKRLLVLMLTGAVWSPLPSAAHTAAHKQAAAPAMVKTEFGQTGDPRKVGRTITVALDDTMRFTPDRVTVNRGDTVRFVVRNRGKVLHEMVLGREADLKAHAELMRKHPGMEHDEPYMAHVAPGKEAAIVWQFTQAGDFMYGCLVPGHFEAGMIGRIKVSVR
jgi:uncharacterized cupredoxin-like copper-binding protein